LIVARETSVNRSNRCRSRSSEVEKQVHHQDEENGHPQRILANSERLGRHELTDADGGCRSPLPQPVGIDAERFERADERGETLLDPAQCSGDVDFPAGQPIVEAGGLRGHGRHDAGQRDHDDQNHERDADPCR
jgi:hypothetical protein